MVLCGLMTWFYWRQSQRYDSASVVVAGIFKISAYTWVARYYILDFLKNLGRFEKRLGTTGLEQRVFQAVKFFSTYLLFCARRIHIPISLVINTNYFSQRCSVFKFEAQNKMKKLKVKTQNYSQ